MPDFVAGAPVSAFVARRALAKVAVTYSDVSMVNDATATDIPGLSVQLDAFARYAFDGYIAHTSASSSATFRLGLAVPAESTGHWSSASVNDGQPTVTGEIFWLRRALVVGALSEAGAVGGAPAMSPIHGYVATTTYAGPLTIQFAQNVAGATPVSINAGSWVRAVQID